MSEALEKPLWVLAKEARAERAGWLGALSSGMVGVADLLAAAQGPSGRALGKLSLEDVLYALMRSRWPKSPSHARRASRAALAEVAARSGVPVSANTLTVSWLLHSRARDRRLDALAEALGRGSHKVPNERWPYR